MWFFGEVYHSSVFSTGSSTQLQEFLLLKLNRASSCAARFASHPKGQILCVIDNPRKDSDGGYAGKRTRINCGLCPLCRREPETSSHLLYEWRYTLRLWDLVRDWLQLVHLDTIVWAMERSIKDWWIKISGRNIPNRSAMASITHVLDHLEWEECKGLPAQIRPYNDSHGGD